LAKRWDQYFRRLDDMRPKVLAQLDKAQASPCRSIGLHAGVDDPEYLLWVGLKQQGRPFELRAVDTPVGSGGGNPPQFHPCLVLGPMER
jgi:hypothetical protein